MAYAEWFGAKYQNESNAFPVFAVEPRRYLNMYQEFTIPHDRREAFVKTRTGAVAGTRLAQRYGWKLGQKVPISSESHPKSDGSMGWEFDLVDTLDADDPAVRGNTMAQSVRERMPELAILKTIGFSDSRVTVLVLAEAVVLLLLGSALGMLAATSLLPASGSRLAC